MRNLRPALLYTLLVSLTLIGCSEDSVSPTPGDFDLDIEIDAATSAEFIDTGNYRTRYRIAKEETGFGEYFRSEPFQVGP